jgi:hypothetical protein
MQIPSGRKAVMLAALCCSAANASEINASKVEEVVVSGRQTNLIGAAVSASEGVISQQELSLRPLLRSGEIIEAVPGMIATQHSGTGKANQYFLRGFNLDHGTDFATWIDNMPVNMRSHGHGQGYTDLNFIIPETIEQLSYRKGSYYASVGDFSGAGQAAMSTLSKTANGTATFTAGEDDYYRALAMDSISTGSSEFIYALELNRYQGPWTDIGEDLEKTNLLLKHSWSGANGDFSVTFMGYDNQWNAADQIPERAVNSGLIDELGSLDEDAGGESSRYSLSLGWKNNGWQAHAYAIQYDLDLWSNFTYFLDDPIDGDEFQQTDSRWIYGGDISYGWKHSVAGIAVENRLGVDTRFDDIDEVGLKRTANRDLLGNVRLDSIEEGSLGVFGDSTWQWTSAFRTVFGLRYDYYHFDVDDKAGTNFYGVDLAANSGTADDDLISPKFSAIYTLNEQWETYYSLGRGFHSNDARGTTIALDPVSGDAVDQVDALVRSTGQELGVRWFLSDKINASLALWELELDSELLYVGDAGATEPSRASKRNGVEATIYYRLNQQWSVDAEYALTNARFAEDAIDEGNKIDGSLEKVASAGINAELGDGWYGSFRMRYFGPRYLESFGNVKSDSSTVYNLLAGKQINDWRVAVEVLNIFDGNDHDIDYLYESQLASEIAAVEDIHYHVMEPRTVRLSVSMQY